MFCYSTGAAFIDRTGAVLGADPGFLAGLNCYDGQITCPPVAEALGLPYVDPGKLL